MIIHEIKDKKIIHSGFKIPLSLREDIGDKFSSILFNSAYFIYQKRVRTKTTLEGITNFDPHENNIIAETYVAKTDNEIRVEATFSWLESSIEEGSNISLCRKKEGENDYSIVSIGGVDQIVKKFNPYKNGEFYLPITFIFWDSKAYKGNYALKLENANSWYIPEISWLIYKT